MGSEIQLYSVQASGPGPNSGLEADCRTSFTAVLSTSLGETRSVIYMPFCPCGVGRVPGLTDRVTTPQPRHRASQSKALQPSEAPLQSKDGICYRCQKKEVRGVGKDFVLKRNGAEQSGQAITQSETCQKRELIHRSNPGFFGGVKEDVLKRVKNTQFDSLWFSGCLSCSFCLSVLFLLCTSFRGAPQGFRSATGFSYIRATIS